MDDEAGPCLACPLAASRAAWNQVPPETADHLLGAAAELLAALRTVIVAGERLVELQRQRIADGRSSPASSAAASSSPAASSTPTGTRRLRRIDIA